jgi:predicted nucleotidyltransferase
VNLGDPAAVIVPSLEGPVLLVLFRDVRPMSAREVHRRASRGSHRAVQLALRRLVEQGIVDVQETRGAHLFTLNRDHVAAPVVALLASLREVFLQRLKDAIARWGRSGGAPLSATLFGSAARGDGDAASDVDLLLVGDDAAAGEGWSEQLQALRSDVRRWTGNELAVSVVPVGRLHELAADRSPLVEALLRDGICLYGPPVSQLLSGVAR